MDISIEVIKEPRGFIRILQCLMAVLAFATTAGFSTDCKFSVCPSLSPDVNLPIEYDIAYPFSHTVVTVPWSCDADKKELKKLELPYDFSNSAEFFVCTGVLCFLYTIGIMVVYIFFHQAYANNSKLPVADLGVTTVLSIFWLAGSSAWAEGVSNLKFYLHPDLLFRFFNVCMKNGSEEGSCKTVEEGSYGTLNASLILGFANFLLWVCSLWFVYKETVFFSSQTVTAPEPSQNQASKSGRV